MPKNLTFTDAEAVRDALTESQKQEIAALYDKWADQLAAKAHQYSLKTNSSAPVTEAQLRQLEAQLRATSQGITNEILNHTVNNLYIMADATVGVNSKWLESLGFLPGPINVAFGSVPDQVVRELVTGQLYGGGWNLSSAIWGANEQVLKDIYGVVAAGVAQNSSIYEIAKNLEAYVRPEARKPWNLKAPDGKLIYRKKVDYNAQRLARTLVQHSYQQSFVTTTQKNPFVEDYIWHANGSRACALCEERDNQHFKKDELPLDHPNGMCVFEPNVDIDKMIDQLADWVNSPDGTFPEIDEFSKNFGYQPNVAQFTPLQEKWLGQFGYTPGNMPQSFSEWSHQLSHEQATEILKLQGKDWDSPHPYQEIQKWYDKNLAKLTSGGVQKPDIVDPTKALANKYGTSSSKTFNYWYTKLPPEGKALAQQLKEASGLTWQKWYEQNIYVPKGGAQAAAQATAQAAQRTALSRAPGQMTPQQMLKAIQDRSYGGSQSTSEMLSMEARAFANMTNSQSAGLRTYTGGSYNSMNSYLRYRYTGMSHAEAVSASGISTRQLTAVREARAGLSHSSLESELIVRRGTSLGDLAGLLPGDYHNNKAMLSNMSPEAINDLLAGKVGTFAGFTSTSSHWDKGFSGNVELIIRVPQGSKASSIMSISQFGTAEGETLLNAGTRVIVDRVEASDGHKGSSIRAYLDVLGIDPDFAALLTK